MLLKQIKDVSELLGAQHQQQEAENRAMFIQILENIRFLVRQGLPLRGHGDDSDSNFI